MSKRSQDRKFLKLIEDRLNYEFLEIVEGKTIRRTPEIEIPQGEINRLFMKGFFTRTGIPQELPWLSCLKPQVIIQRYNEKKGSINLPKEEKAKKIWQIIKHNKQKMKCQEDKKNNPSIPLEYNESHMKGDFHVWFGNKW